MVLGLAHTTLFDGIGLYAGESVFVKFNGVGNRDRFGEENRFGGEYRLEHDDRLWNHDRLRNHDRFRNLDVKGGDARDPNARFFALASSSTPILWIILVPTRALGLIKIVLALGPAIRDRVVARSISIVNTFLHNRIAVTSLALIFGLALSTLINAFSLNAEEVLYARINHRVFLRHESVGYFGWVISEQILVVILAGSSDPLLRVIYISACTLMLVNIVVASGDAVGIRHFTEIHI